MRDDTIIIGQEIIYKNHKSNDRVTLGRVESFSSWSGEIEHIFVMPHIANASGAGLEIKPEHVIELIDPRPPKRRGWTPFG